MNNLPSRMKSIPENLLPWVICFAASLFFCYELVQLHMLGAISDYVMKDLNLSGSQFGFLSSTYLIADVIFLLPAGIILDYFSTRKTILCALFFCILGTLGLAFSHSLTFAALSHFLSGIGNAFCFLSCMILVSRWFPERSYAFIMGLMVSIGLLGGFLAQSPFTYLAEALSWRNALIIDASIGLVVFCLIAYFVFDAPNNYQKQEEVSARAFLKNLGQAIKNRQTYTCAIFTGVFNLPLMIFGPVWGALFLKQVHAFSMVHASFIVSTLCLGSIAGAPLVGYLSDKLGERKPIMWIGGLLSVFTILLIIYLPEMSYVNAIALFFSLGLSTSVQVIGYPTITENNPPHLRGTAMGMAAVIIMGMPAILQPLSGKLLDAGWSGALQDGVRLFSHQNYIDSFLMFPIAFGVALLALFALKEKEQWQIYKT